MANLYTEDKVLPSNLAILAMALPPTVSKLSKVDEEAGTPSPMARPPDQTASWSARRALLTPQVNPGSPYRRGRSS